MVGKTREIRQPGQLTSGGNKKPNKCCVNRLDDHGPHWGSNVRAPRSFNSVGWPLRTLAGGLTLQQGGYRNPVAGSLALVGWLLCSLAGCLTLQLIYYRGPIVGIPFTAVLSHSVLLLYLCPDGSCESCPQLSP